jgi:hypothetical protein
MLRRLGFPGRPEAPIDDAGEAHVSGDFLDERRKSLEDEFFHKENQQKLADLKKKLAAKATREELAEASGMDDEAVLDRLASLGLRGETVAALSLVPLIAVAWADGAIQESERNAILQSAKGKGFDEKTASYEILSAWLNKKPDDSLLDAWESYIKALNKDLNPEQQKLMRTQIVGFARMIAESAGGVLGFGKVSSAEEKVLARIEAAFH